MSHAGRDDPDGHDPELEQTLDMDELTQAEEGYGLGGQSEERHVPGHQSEERYIPEDNAGLLPGRRGNYKRNNTAPGLVRKLEHMTHLLQSLDKLVFAEVAAFYYLEYAPTTP